MKAGPKQALPFIWSELMLGRWLPAHLRTVPLRVGSPELHFKS
jgi:hypothetical protein